MQVVIALPRVEEVPRLDRPVCGVAVLTRVIGTAVRSGGTHFLLLVPPGLSQSWLATHLQSRAIGSVCIRTLEIDSTFDSADAEDWRAIAHALDDRFLWIPCDYLAHKRALTDLLATATAHPGSAVRFSGAADSWPEERRFERPLILLKGKEIDRTEAPLEIAFVPGQPGIPLRAPASFRSAEVELVRHSGKITDGIYSRFNRKLCRPSVRWLSRTRVTPNIVSFGGLAVATVAGVCFVQGSWLFDVVGALLFFVSGLFDEIDGMLARLKFQESPFGCWLETFIDYTTYVLVFAGMTAGGYRRAGSAYLFLGAAVVFGSLVSFWVISVQRRLAAPAGKPHEYSQRYLRALDRDSGNLISRTVRQLQFLTKKGVLIHYLVLLAVLRLVPLFLFLSAVGANIAWIVTIYFNRRLFRPRRSVRSEPAYTHATPVEVEK